jgi:capsular polysaccharide biosynthesis protein
MNQSKMATDLEKRQQGEQFRMLDEPNLPDAPFSPKRSVFLFGGIFAGLAVGLSIAAFLEFKSPVLRTERDIWAFTKLPTLAVIAFAGDMPVAPKTSRLRRLFGRKKAANLALEARG